MVDKAQRMGQIGVVCIEEVEPGRDNGGHTYRVCAETVAISPTAARVASMGEYVMV